jgi:hypothetical protein
VKEAKEKLAVDEQKINMLYLSSKEFKKISLSKITSAFPKARDDLKQT